MEICRYWFTDYKLKGETLDIYIPTEEFNLDLGNKKLAPTPTNVVDD